MTNNKHRALLERARKDYAAAVDGDRENRDEALNDLRFLTGDQWPDDVKQERENGGRPMLTVNRMPQFLRQVTGDIRQTNPAIDVIPGDSEASKETAEIYDGLVRQIERKSDATTIYEGAAESAAACGLGWFRVLTDYVGPNSFDQEIKIERIANPFSVHCDPDAKHPTRMDARFIFVEERIPRVEFEDNYPDSDTSGWEAQAALDGFSDWYSKDSVLVVEYFYAEPVKRDIYQLDDGSIVEELPEGVRPAQKRTVTENKIMWCKMIGNEVLEEPKQVPGVFIPVVACVGEELHVSDKVVRTSVIRYAKDPQRMYNYWRSAQTEIVALQPKAPFIVTHKQVEGQENLWKSANTSNYPFLPYTPDEHAPPPMRQSPAVSSSGMTQEIMLASDDMKATTGIYDAGLGNQSNEQSGVAIRQRQLEGDISTSIYSDNLAKSIAQCGRIIVGWIPVIYDTTRTIRVLSKDNTPMMADINTPVRTPEGDAVINDMSAGKFDVIVKTGPNFSTKRQESAESMQAFVQAFPQAQPLVGDLIAKNMDWAGADEFAERLKKLVPPELLQGEEEPSPEQQQMAAIQQQMQQQQIQIEQMIAESEARKSVAEADKAEAQAIEAKIDVEAAKQELIGAADALDRTVQAGTVNNHPLG